MEENLEETTFEVFFKEKVREHNLTLKKLSEISGISVKHLESLGAGNFEELPPDPYVRGYLIKLGDILGFDGEAAWTNIKKEDLLSTSGPDDKLPKNRFAKGISKGKIFFGVSLLLVLLYFAVRFTAIFGKPNLAVLTPEESISTVAQSPIMVTGTLRNGSRVFINGEPIAIGKNGSWEKSITLQSGLNTIEISAKKFLGREVKTLRQIFYEASGTPEASPPTIEP